MDSPQSNNFHHIDTPPEDRADAPDHHSTHLAQLLGVIAGLCGMIAWLSLCAYLAWQFLKPFIYYATHSPVSSTTLL